MTVPGSTSSTGGRSGPNAQITWSRATRCCAAPVPAADIGSYLWGSRRSSQTERRAAEDAGGLYESQGGGLCTQRPATIVATTCASRCPRVAVEHDQIRVAPGDQRAALAFVAGEPGGRHAGRVERLVNGDALLGMPRVALVDRAADAGPDSRERVELLDRRVASVHDPRARVEQRAKRVGAAGLPGPELVGEITVGRRVRELHGTGHADLLEAWEILGGEQLRVLDALTQPARLPCVAGLLESIQRLAVRLVADRMHADRESGLSSPAHDVGQLVAARDLDARAVEHPRRPGAQRPVHEHLQVADPEVGAPEAGAEPDRDRLVETVVRDRLPNT